jgi:alanyl-tRNA synthetase
LTGIEPEKIGGIDFLDAHFTETDPASLREEIDRLRGERKNSVIFFSSENEGKLVFLCGVSADLTSKIKAGDLVKAAAQIAGGGGGGRPDFAQAGGKDVTKLKEAIQAVKSAVGK